MPERSFRRHTLRTLELVLQGLAERGLACVTLSSLLDDEEAGESAGVDSDFISAGSECVDQRVDDRETAEILEQRPD